LTNKNVNADWMPSAWMHARDENSAAHLQVLPVDPQGKQSTVIIRKWKLFGTPSSRQEMSIGYEHLAR